MRIAVDAAGGDFFPKNPVEGALDALKERDDLEILLIGPSEMIQKELDQHTSYPKDRIQVVDAPDVIGMEESPAKAVKTKPNSSIVIGNTLQKKGECDAIVSAGNTGALLAASTVILGRLKGVLRPALTSVFPTVKGFRLLVDAGANLEVKPEILYQFGVMGKIYAENILQLENPRVGLLNVGEEEKKGTEEVQGAYQLLKELDNFVGNIEGRDILPCNADVFVCDGFVGNIALKFGESIADSLQEMIKSTLYQSDLEDEQKLMVAGIIRQALSPFDYQLVGGVPLLGVNGISIVGHGSSSPLAMKNMILASVRCVETSINAKIVSHLN